MKKETKKEEITKQKQSQEELQQALQEKYMEYQMLQEQLGKMSEQSETLKKQTEELETLKEAVHAIQETKVGSEMFVPISSGIFVKAEIKETNEVLMNVGDNVVVPKNMKDAVALIQKQQNEINGYEKTMQQNIQILLIHQQRIETELMALTKEE
ncbi:prefoldin subunit alpha [Candidatus Woesearchaeota archaeon]|nr:prefoldin subunit alpha [Candidatus Woesearchaeota archaeon]